MNRRTSLQLLGAMSALIALPILSGCATNYLLTNPNQQSVGEGLTIEEMRSCVRNAAASRDWRIVSDQKGLMQLAYPANPAKAQHFEALVQVKYSADRYQVSYLSSRGLGERTNCALATQSSDPNARCIHRNVNRWMNNLNVDIYREVMKISR